ncbi:hypothetical protein AAC387_Pa08g1599 [Persea americana]
MGKLGKKARKFSKKHLQSVLKQRRKFKSMRDSFKRKNSLRNEGDSDEEHVKATTNHATGANFEGIPSNGAVEDVSLDAIFSDDDHDSIEDDTHSDGFLSEDSNSPYVADSENKNNSEEKSDCGALLGQNEGILLELTKQKRKLERLKKKDPEFLKFLEVHSMDIEHFGNKVCSDEEGEMRDHCGANLGNGLDFHEGRVLTLSTVDAWCQLVIEKQSMLVLPTLLNGYRAACHYGTDEDPDEISCWRIEKREVFCKILMFVIQEASGIFQKLLGISSSSCKNEIVLELKNSDKWKTMKPLLKSYLRSTLYLLDQVTDHQILEFTLSRLRTSIIFFAAFPTLLQRLIKVAVHLWATGGGSVSSSAFLVLRDIAVQLNLKCLDTCLKKTYKAYIAQCLSVESANPKHVQFLSNSVVELYSLDLQKAYHRALVSVQQLANILQQALKAKKESLEKIYNFQYTSCLDLWVKFISANVRDHDLQPLLYLVIQLICGVAHLFPGPRYLPLRLKCIQMLNLLSTSSGVFIPVASLALSALDYEECNKSSAISKKNLNPLSLLKVPKRLLKSRDFQEGCILSAMNLLSAHFAQWSYHISFPELATIPLIRLRIFHEKTTVESLKRLVKRLIDQVEQNVEFVQKRRDDVTFSPKDQATIDSFLLLEKSGGKTPFSQYYASVLQKFNSQNLVMNEKTSELKQSGSRKRKQPVRDSSEDVRADGETAVVKNVVANSTVGSKRDKKQTKSQRT